MTPEFPSFTWKKIQTLIKNEKRIRPLPMIPVNNLDKYLLPNPMIRNPTKGNSGTR
jgi:hypothetical protein